MKKGIMHFGIYALLAISVIFTASCGNDVLNGTIWTAELDMGIGHRSVDVILAFNDKNYTMYRDGEKINGKYSLSGNNVKLTPVTPEYVSDPMLGTLSKSNVSLSFYVDELDQDIWFTSVSTYTGEEFETQYPIGLVSYTRFPYELTVNKLLDQNNLFNMSSRVESIETTIELVFIPKYNTLTIILFQSVNDESLRCVLSFENDSINEMCNVTYICFTAIESGEVLKIKDNGTARTMGELVGAFVEIVKRFYEQEKLR